jgi:hypothetical protein
MDFQPTGHFLLNAMDGMLNCSLGSHKMTHALWAGQRGIGFRFSKACSGIFCSLQQGWRDRARLIDCRERSRQDLRKGRFGRRTRLSSWRGVSLHPAIKPGPGGLNMAALNAYSLESGLRKGNISPTGSGVMFTCPEEKRPLNHQRVRDFLMHVT